MMGQSTNRMAFVWRSIKDHDADKNGFLAVDELDGCFREHFAPELEGKSMVYYFRKFSTDHDKDLVNYRKIKEGIVSKMDVFKSSEMMRSGTLANLHAAPRKEIATGAAVEQFTNRPLKVS